MCYTVSFYTWGDKEGCTVIVLLLPGCITQGYTEEGGTYRISYSCGLKDMT
jgi:predicted RNase H-like HicB family nuclease